MIASQPWRDLDHENLRELVERTLSDRFGYFSPTGEVIDDVLARQRGRTRTEQVAMATVMTMLERIGKLVENCPRELEWYLRQRWHIETSFGPTPLEVARENLRDRGGL